MNWLSRLLLAWRDRPDPAWKPTGLKFTTGRDYDQDQGIRMAREARLKSSTGRVYRKPAKPKQPAPVVSIRRQG
jgi:hypothetical protein